MANVELRYLSLPYGFYMLTTTRTLVFSEYIHFYTPPPFRSYLSPFLEKGLIFLFPCMGTGFCVFSVCIFPFPCIFSL